MGSDEPVSDLSFGDLILKERSKSRNFIRRGSLHKAVFNIVTPTLLELIGVIIDGDGYFLSFSDIRPITGISQRSWNVVHANTKGFSGNLIADHLSKIIDFALFYRKACPTFFPWLPFPDISSELCLAEGLGVLGFAVAMMLLQKI